MKYTRDTKSVSLKRQLTDSQKSSESLIRTCTYPIPVRASSLKPSFNARYAKPNIELHIMKSKKNPKSFAINEPAKHPKAPPSPAKELNIPVLRLGISSIESDVAEIRNNPYDSPNAARLAVDNNGSTVKGEKTTRAKNRHSRVLMALARFIKVLSPTCFERRAA